MIELTIDDADDRERAHEGEGARTYVVFRLGGEGYALEVRRVREVLDLPALTAVPGGPPSLLGVVNLRGHVVPVYDLRDPFGLPPGPEPAPARAPGVLIVESGPGPDPEAAGLRVDRVSDVLEFAPDEVQPAPALGLGRASPFVRGLIRHQEGFLLVLDADRVLEALGPGENGGP